MEFIDVATEGRKIILKVEQNEEIVELEMNTDEAITLQNKLNTAIRAVKAYNKTHNHQVV